MKLNVLFLSFVLMIGLIPRMGFAQTTTSDQQIESDLEDLLTTQGQIVADIQRDNLSLLGAALRYNKSQAVFSLAESTVIAFFLLREPVRLGTLYMANIARLVDTIKAGEQLKSFEYIERGAAVTTTSFGLAFGASLFYMSTNLFQKGVCVFNCVSDFASRVTEEQEAEFLRSPTYTKIESEIGKQRALQFMAIMKQLRSENYSNEYTMNSLVRLVDSVAGRKLKSLDHLEIAKAPTFARVIEVISGVYNLNELVMGYLTASGQMI